LLTVEIITSESVCFSTILAMYFSSRSKFCPLHAHISAHIEHVSRCISS